MEQPKYSMVYGTIDTVKTKLSAENGIMIGYTVVLPNFTTAATAVLTIIDNDGYTVYTGDAKNKNATSVVMGLTVPMGSGYVITLTLNAQSGGAATAVVKTYIKKE